MFYSVMGKKGHFCKVYSAVCLFFYFNKLEKSKREIGNTLKVKRKLLYRTSVICNRSVRQTQLSPHAHTHTRTYVHIGCAFAHPHKQTLSHTHTHTLKVDNLIQLPTHSSSQPLFVSARLFSLQIGVPVQLPVLLPLS